MVEAPPVLAEGGGLAPLPEGKPLLEGASSRSTAFEVGLRLALAGSGGGWARGLALLARKRQKAHASSASRYCSSRGTAVSCVESLGKLSVVCLLAWISRVAFEHRLDKRGLMGFELESRTRLGLVAEILEKLVTAPVSERKLGMEARAGVRR